MVHISERERQLPDLVIGKLLQIANEDKSVISLAPGEPNFPLPAPLVKEVKYYADKSNHYSPPGGRHELKEAIMKKLMKDNKIKVNPENIIVTTGSQEALMLASVCTLDVGDEAIVPDPSYMCYLPTIELMDGTPIRMELKEEEGFDVNPDRLRKLIDKKRTKFVILNSPSNPTGNVLSKKILEEVADIARENNIFIFSDEAYEKIVYDKKHVSIGSLNGMEDYVVTFQTFSKSFAMCGFRLGYAAGPEKLIKAMTNSHLYTTTTANTLSQLVGVKALEMNHKYVDVMVKEYRRRRDLIVKRLNEIGLRTVKPEGAFYTFSNITNFSNNSFMFAKNLLEKAKVAAVPGSEFGRHGEGFLRFSYATDYYLIEKAMKRIEKFVKK